MKAGKYSKKTMVWAACLALPALSGPAALTRAAETNSHAAAGHDGYGNRRAEAAAGYDGALGFARTRTHTGPISTARGVALGLDEDGLSLSLSHAISGPFGRSAARNLNLSIGMNGQVAVSRGSADSNGSRGSSAYAGGGSGVCDGRTVAYGDAGGTTDRNGGVTSEVITRTSPARRGARLAGESRLNRIARPHTYQRGESSYHGRPVRFEPSSCESAPSTVGGRLIQKCATPVGRRDAGYSGHAAKTSYSVKTRKSRR